MNRHKIHRQLRERLLVVDEKDRVLVGVGTERRVALVLGLLLEEELLGRLFALLLLVVHFALAAD